MPRLRSPLRLLLIVAACLLAWVGAVVREVLTTDYSLPRPEPRVLVGTPLEREGPVMWGAATIIVRNQTSEPLVVEHLRLDGHSLRRFEGRQFAVSGKWGQAFSDYVEWRAGTIAGSLEYRKFGETGRVRLFFDLAISAAMSCTQTLSITDLGLEDNGCMAREVIQPY